METDSIELSGSLAIGLYIIFFASNPPDLLRMALANPVLLALVVSGCAYVTMYVSNSVGILLMLAVLISMTSVTEYLTTTTSDGEQLELLDGEFYKCKGSDDMAVVRDGKLNIIPSVEKAASYIDNLKTYVREIDCNVGSSNEERPSSNAKCNIPAHQEGYDRPGQKLEMIEKVPDVAACGSKCCNNSRCESYTYFNLKQQCQLYIDRTFTVQSSSEANTGVVNRGETSQGSAEPEPERKPAVNVSEPFDTMTSSSRVNPSLVDGTACNVENFTPF
jgi:hypothetical protein